MKSLISVAFNEVVFHLSSVFSRHTLLKWRVYSDQKKMKKCEFSTKIYFYKSKIEDKRDPTVVSVIYLIK